MDFKALSQKNRDARESAEKYGQGKMDACIAQARAEALRLCDEPGCEWANESGFWYQSYPSGVPYRKVRYQFRDRPEGYRLFYIEVNP